MNKREIKSKVLFAILNKYESIREYSTTKRNRINLFLEYKEFTINIENNNLY